MWQCMTACNHWLSPTHVIPVCLLLLPMFAVIAAATAAELLHE